MKDLITYGGLLSRRMALAVVVMLSMACHHVTEDNDSAEEVVLAEVYDQKLTLAEIQPLIEGAMSAEDSIALVRSHVETWVRETLLLHEAEKNAPADVNINKLVQDYRASLLLSHYENVLAKTLLDTVVTDAELRASYEQTKEQYRLEAPIVRVYYVRLPKDVGSKDVFQRLWRSDRPDDFEALGNFCQKYAIEYLLSDSTWLRQPDIERLLPPGSLNGQNMSPGRSFRFSDSASEYYLEVRQRIGASEIAPLSYVGEQARRFILHKRKIDLLEKIKADIYEREIKGDQVKIRI